MIIGGIKVVIAEGSIVYGTSVKFPIRVVDRRECSGAIRTNRTLAISCLI